MNYKMFTARTEGLSYPKSLFDVEYSDGHISLSLKSDVDRLSIYKRRTNVSVDTDISLANVINVITISAVDNDIEDTLIYLFFDQFEKDFSESFLDYENISVNVYTVLPWVDAISYKKGDICCHSEVLYMCDNDNTDSEPTSENADWIVLEEQEDDAENKMGKFVGQDNDEVEYNLRNNPSENSIVLPLLGPGIDLPPQFSEGGNIVSISIWIGTQASSKYTGQLLRQLSCNTFEVDFTGSGSISSAILRAIPYDDINAEVINTFIGEDIKNLIEDNKYKFSVPGDDGIYVLLIKVNEEWFYQGYLFVNCRIEECFNKLITSIYCEDLDCCEICSEAIKREIDFRRNELRKLNVFLSKIAGLMNYMNVNTTGYIWQSREEKVIAEKANNLYKFVKEVVTRCGSCGPIDKSKKCSKC